MLQIGSDNITVYTLSGVILMARAKLALDVKRIQARRICVNEYINALSADMKQIEMSP